MGDNTNLHAAKRTKDDEFYTQYQDIEIELNNYKKYLRGKTIYCNCDRDESNFVKFLSDVKEEWGIRNIYHTSIQDGVDFRSEKSIEILNKSDVVISNPPFSLFRQYVAQIMEYKKEFLIIGSKNAITYKEFFPLIRSGKVWIGYNNVHNFSRPDGSIKKFGNVGWFTNLPVDKAHSVKLINNYYDEMGNPKEMSLQKYPKYDNYDAINVDKVSEIPRDYFGVMGVPITVLDKFTPSGGGYLLDNLIFDIVAFRKGSDGKDLVFTRIEEVEYNSRAGRERESTAVLQNTYLTSIPGMIKNAEGKIQGCPTYARITIIRI